ncbi:MAG: 50S ribosomal protein L15 [Pseudomonadota bacterium]|nr:50S ribosomal protein L15 [Pseudomonadota bacterium]
MILKELSDNSGAKKNRKRVGRGPGSGSGKTAGRGMKGQKSRSGVSIKGFEGGQMPLYRRLAKRGFNNIFRKQFVELGTGRLQAMVDAKRVDAKKEITVESLVESGVLRRAKDGVRLLVKGELSAKVAITVAGASRGAVAMVEKAGGTVTVIKKSKNNSKGEEAAEAELLKSDA